MNAILTFVICLAAICNGRSFPKNPVDISRNFDTSSGKTDETGLSLQELSKWDGRIPDLPIWAPEISVGTLFNGKKIEGAQLIVAEDPVIAAAMLREDGAYEFNTIWRTLPFYLSVGGDSKGDLFAQVNPGPVTVAANVQTLMAGHPFAVDVIGGPVGAGITGDTSGLKTYALETDLGPVGLRFSGDAKGGNKQLDVYADLRYEAYDYYYDYQEYLGRLGGGVLLELRGDTFGYRGGNGTLQLGPLGARIEYEGRGIKNSYAFVQTPVAYVVGSFGSSFPKVQSVYGTFKLHPFSFEIVSDKPSIDLSTIVRGGFNWQNAVVVGEYHLQSKQAVLYAQYAYQGYGLSLLGTTDKSFQIGLILNNRRFLIPFPNMYNLDPLNLYDEGKRYFFQLI